MATPTGIFGGPMQALKAMFCASTTFQAWAGAANATEAEANVAFVNVATAPDPMIFIAHYGQTMAQSKNNATAFAVQQSIYVLIEALATETDPDDSVIAFANLVGPVIREVMNQNGAPGNLMILEIAQEADFSITYGPEANEPGDDANNKNAKCQVAFVFRVGST